ncbi:MAG: hypothetical protein JRF52_07065 [Deltaproteobacteria bacterium]|nr:hypothetical protein [Deltaproteobacteria bacterium]
MGVKKNLTVPPEAGWSQRGASIWISQFRASLDVVSVSRAPMTPGGLEMVEI